MIASTPKRAATGPAPAAGVVARAARPVTLPGDAAANASRAQAWPGRAREAHYRPGGSVLGKCALSPGLQVAAGTMSEDALERAMLGQIRDIRKLGIGFLAWHPWKQHAKRAARGFLDWTLLSRRRLIFRELKRQGCYPTKEQQEWLDGLQAVGQDADVWQPCCLLSGRIAGELTEAAGIGGDR